jgi:hypothetical protein
MKPQLATGVQSVSTAYGDILYRAYREIDSDTSLPLLHSLEDHLQDLGYCTIHAHNKKYFQNLKNCLNLFHQNKNIKGIDGLLLKIYGPFIWRSLKSSNPLVRTQASVIFLTIFPLYNSTDTASGGGVMNQMELDRILQKQFNLILLLLKDSDHRVRASAVKGVCHILKEFWEVIPSQSTHQILSYLVGTLGFDSSDASIRVNVVTGLQELLRNPLCHVALRGLFPILSNLLHDYSDRVRYAFIQLLQKIKMIRGFKFYEIVSLERLCDQFNRDAKKPFLCSAMTQLLLNSFYPRAEYAQQEEEEEAGGQGQGQGDRIVDYSREQIKRALSFVHSYEAAALVFYSNLYQQTSVGSATKLCVMLWNVLLSQRSSSSRRHQGANDADADAGGGGDEENVDHQQNQNQRRGQEKEKEKGKGKEKKSKSQDSLSRAKRGREEVDPKKKKNTTTTASSSSSSQPDHRQDNQQPLSFQPELGYEILLVMEAILKPLRQKLSESSYQPSKALLQQHLSPASLQSVLNRLRDLKLISDAEKKMEDSVSCHVAISSLLEVSSVMTSLSHHSHPLAAAPPRQVAEDLSVKKKGKGKGKKEDLLETTASAAATAADVFLSSDEILSIYYEEEGEGEEGGEGKSEGEAGDETFRLAILNSVMAQCASDPSQLFQTSLWDLIERDFAHWQGFLAETAAGVTAELPISSKRRGKGTISPQLDSRFPFNRFEKTLQLLFTFLDASSSPLLVDYRRQVLSHEPSYRQLQALLRQAMDAISSFLRTPVITAPTPAHVSKIEISCAFVAHLWTLLSLQKDLLEGERSHGAPSGVIREVMDWVTEVIFPNLTSPEIAEGDQQATPSRSLSELLLATIFSPITDSLLIDENPSSMIVLETLNQWAIQLLHTSSTALLSSSLPSITRLLTVLSSPHLKVSFPSGTNLHQVQSTIQSAWCNWMDILLLHISFLAVQTLLISYLKLKESKQPTRFQTLLLNRLLSYLLQGISARNGFDWKSCLLGTKSDLMEEKLTEGIEWKEDQKVPGSVCAEIILSIISSAASLDLVFTTLLSHLSTLSRSPLEEFEDSRRKLGLTLFLRRVMKSSQLNDNHHQLLEQVMHSPSEITGGQTMKMMELLEI